MRGWQLAACAASALWLAGCGSKVGSEAHKTAVATPTAMPVSAGRSHDRALSDWSDSSVAAATPRSPAPRDLDAAPAAEAPPAVPFHFKAESAPRREPTPHRELPAHHASEPRVATISTGGSPAVPPIVARPGEPAPSAKPADPAPRPKQQSGQLTAGSLDDQRAYDDYLEFLNRSPLKKWLPDYLPTSRVVVTVRNEAGERIPEARVQVQRTNKQSPPAELTTGSDGRAVFVAGLDLPYQHEQCTVTVTAPNSQPHVTEMSTEDVEWTLVVPDAPRNLPTRLDLALVIDVTGSMQDELEYLQAEIDGIVATVKRKYPNITQRFGLIVYRDHGDEFVTRAFDFTESLSEFQANLNRQHAAGGGDYPEAVPEALEQAAKLSWSDHSAARLVFLVADAPPHDRDAKRSFDLVRAMRQKSISLFPVGASGVREEAEYLFRASAFVTQGQYLFLTDHSGVGSAHAKPTAPRYEVERLDQLMTRMIAWKLTGDEHQADRILDIDGAAVPPHSSQPPAAPQSSTTSPPPTARVAFAHPVPVVESATRWDADGVAILCKSCLAIIAISLLLGAPIRDGIRSFRNRDRGAPA